MGLPRSYLSSTDAGWAATSSWEAQEDKNVFPRIASLQAKWKCWSSRGPGRRASLQRPRPSDFDRLQDTGARRRSMANSTTHVFRRRASYHASCCTMHGSQRTPFHGSVADDPSEIRGGMCMSTCTRTLVDNAATHSGTFPPSLCARTGPSGASDARAVEGVQGKRYGSRAFVMDSRLSAPPRSRDRGGRLVVTGASGFIGRWASRALQDLGYEVHCFSRSGRSGGGATWHVADVLDCSATRHLISEIGAERLLHLAWETEHGAYWDSPLNERWLDATKELITSFHEAGGTRVVCAGTCAEYDWADPGLARESCYESTTRTAPRTPYGAAKLALGAWLASRKDLSSATGRGFFLYGEGEDRRRLVPSSVLAILEGGQARTGPGSLIRDFLHVADGGAAFAALLASEVQGPVNVASGTATTIARVVSTIARLLDQPDAVGIGALPGRPGDPPRLVASVERLGREVGFSPTIDLDAGIGRSIAWLKSERAQSASLHGTDTAH
jgi:nucleoside-diphosphate-sugar epimerase